MIIATEEEKRNVVLRREKKKKNLFIKFFLEHISCVLENFF